MHRLLWLIYRQRWSEYPQRDKIEIPKNQNRFRLYKGGVMDILRKGQHSADAKRTRS